MKIIIKVASKISDKMVHRAIVKKEDAELYQYGIENGIVIAVNLLASMFFGVVTGRLGVVLVFLLFYSTLRTYSGGIHCKSKKSCFVLSLLILFVPVFSYEWVMENVEFSTLIIIGIIAIMVILILSPVASINKRLDDKERKYYKQISRCTVVVQGCVLVFLFCVEIYKYFYAGYCSILLVAVFMILGKISTIYYI